MDTPQQQDRRTATDCPLGQFLEQTLTGATAVWYTIADNYPSFLRCSCEETLTAVGLKVDV